MALSSQDGISLAGLTPLVPTQLMKVDGGRVPTLTPPPSRAETEAQIQRQNTQPVDAVFRVNGRVVAAMQPSGTVFFSNATALNDQRALDFGSVESTLRQRFGNALQVERYSPGTGPAYGAIQAEVHGGKGWLVDARA